VAPGSPLRPGAPAGLPSSAAIDNPRPPGAPRSGNLAAEPTQGSPPASRAATEQPQPSAPQQQAAPSKAASDPRADEAAIRELLRAYEAAWEALDYDALRGVQALSGDSATRVRETMNLAREYRMALDVDHIVVADDGRSATARCRVTREFHPRIGRTTRQTGRSEFRLEKRDGGWVIVELQ
jgi:hypothetical protein